MRRIHRTHISDLRGASRLVVDASKSTTDVVERMHRTIQSWRLPLGSPTRERTRGLTGFIYRSIRAGMSLVGHGIDHGLAGLSLLAPEPRAASTPSRDAAVALLNGVYGDYLEESDNPLAVTMSLWQQGRRVDPDDPTSTLTSDSPLGASRLLVLVHGLCMNEGQWSRGEHDHGAGLSQEVGYTPVYVRYNSGRAIAANGRDLAEMLDKLVGKLTPPLDEIVIVGFSMGGLVARSAMYHASEAELAWPRRVRKLVFLGTPHHGALLERIGVFIDALMDLSPYSAPLTRVGKARSRGINDLCQGTITSGRHVPAALPAGVACYAAAATRASRRGSLCDLLGDGLVGVQSALGHHADPSRDLAIPPERQRIVYRMRHLDLLDDSGVFAQLCAWLRE